MQAGLVLADAQAALFTFLGREIQVGDRVLWAERDDSGEFLHQTRDGRDDALVFAEGIVTAQPQGWYGGNTIVRDDGRTISIGRKWLIKVSDPLCTPKGRWAPRCSPSWPPSPNSNATP